MKKLLVLALVLASSFAIYGQTAKFYADTSSLIRRAGSQSEVERVMQMQWLINGKPLTFGSDTVEIVTDKTTLDTILFKRDTKSKWDTIICNIAKPYSYNFTLNPCCGGFDVLMAKRRVPMELNVKIKGKSKNMYLARLEETGKVITGSGEQTITPLCRSMMKPYIFWIMLQQVEVCTDVGNCEKNEEFCIQKENGERDYEFSYIVKKTIAKFLYMPLDNTPLRISYKPKKDKLKIK